MTPGAYPDITASAYHASPGVSKSQLDLIAIAPALLLWEKAAPRDPCAPLDFGQAFHTLVLEPLEFDERHSAAPAINRRTKVGKAEWEEFIEEARESGRTILDHDEFRKLHLMHLSLRAHPVARMLLDEASGKESTLFWRDPATGELCRARPDFMIPARRIMADLKSSADVERFDASAWDYRYHVSHAHYLSGAREVFGGDWKYIFLVVSTSLNKGRYPVHIFELSADLVAAGEEERARNMATYAECKRSGKWPGVELLSRPRWAK